MQRPSQSRRVNAGFVVVLLSLVSATAASAEEPELEFDSFLPINSTDWLASENEALGIRHAVVLLDRMIFDDREVLEGATTVQQYFRARVFDRKAIEDLGQVEMPYPTSAKIDRLRARTVKPDGREIPVDPRSFRDGILASGGKTKLRVKSFAFENVEPGDILEFAYRYRTDRRIPPRADLRHTYYTLDASVVWRLARLPEGLGAVVLLPDELLWAPRWLVINGRDHPIEVKILPDERRPEMVYARGQSLPAYPEEEFDPPAESFATAFIGSYSFPRLDAKEPFWDRTARDWGGQTDDSLMKRKRLRPWMSSILESPRDLESDLERCLALLQADIVNWDFLPEHERPEEGTTNKNVDDILEKRGATGDGLGILYLAMLRELGYQPTLSWLRDRASGLFLREWENAGQFTLSAVALPDSNSHRWIFPGLPRSTARTIPWQAQGCETFQEILDDPDEPTGLRFDLIPLEDATVDSVVVEIDLALEENGTAAGRMKARWNSATDPSWIAELAAKEGRDRWLEVKPQMLGSLEWKDESGDVVVEGLTFTARCSLRVEGIVEDAGPRRLVALGRLRTDEFSLPSRPRELPIHFDAPRHFSTEVSLRVPPGWRVESTPDPHDLSTAYGTLETRWTPAQGTVRMERRFERLHSMFLPRAAEPMRAFFEQVARTAPEPVVFIQGEGEGEGP